MGGHTVAFSFNTNIFPKAAYLFGGLFGHYKSTSNYRFGGLFITFNLQTNDALPLYYKKQQNIWQMGHGLDREKAPLQNCALQQ